VVSRSAVRCWPDLESGSSAEFLQGFSREFKAFRRGLSEVSKFVLSTTNDYNLTRARSDRQMGGSLDAIGCGQEALGEEIEALGQSPHTWAEEGHLNFGLVWSI